jgi:hypothetical protein
MSTCLTVVWPLNKALQTDVSNRHAFLPEQNARPVATPLSLSLGRYD